MIKRFILACSLCVLLTSMQSAFARGEMSMLSKENKPFFRVVYDLSGCNYEIRVNDVPVEKNTDGMPGASWAPANRWMHSGTNTISVSILPTARSQDADAARELCKAHIKLMLGSFDSPKDKDAQVMSITYNAPSNSLTETANNLSGCSKSGMLDSKNKLKLSDDGDIKISNIVVEKIKNQYGNGIKVSRAIDVSIPLPKWKWLTSDKIINNEETKKELVNQYRKIWEAIHGKQMLNLESLFKERDQEFAEAFYSPIAKMSIVKQLEDAIDDQSLIQGGNIPDKGAYLHVFGNDRLAIITPWDGGPAIFFNYANKGGSRCFVVIFRKEGDKWIITR